jgi:signal transduction histidine kinase
VDRALETFQPEEGEWRAVWPDGTIHWLVGRFQAFKDHAGKPLRLVGVNIDITDRKEAEAEILALRDRLAADLAGMNRLHALSTRLVRQGDMQTLLDAILDAGIALTGAHKGHVQLFDPVSGKVVLMDQRGFDPAFVEYSGHIRPGILATGLAMQTHQRVAVEDVTVSPLFLADPRALQLVLDAGMRAVVCVPLLTRTGQCVGTISILFAVPHQPSERDLRLLDLLARQAVDFIERTKAEESLRAARQQLAEANADLERKVQERTAKLREAVAELEQMSYSMVHDMRAPLRAMQSFAGLMQEECEGCRRPPGLDYLGRIRESSDRLGRLITDALNYNRVVRENLPIAPVDLGRLLRGMVQTYPNLQPPVADITLDLPELVVLGNKSLLTQCFGNLLDNAVKFVAQGVKPCVRVWAEPSTLNDQPATTINIKDNGIGVPKEAQEKIFHMFQRMHRESEYPGTGIGLTIVRKAVERMNGHVSLDSEPGKGTRFRVELPRLAEAPDAERLQNAA